MLVLRLTWFRNVALIASNHINASNFVDTTFFSLVLILSLSLLLPPPSFFFFIHFLSILAGWEIFNPLRLRRLDITNMGLRSVAPSTPRHLVLWAPYNLASTRPLKPPPAPHPRVPLSRPRLHAHSHMPPAFTTPRSTFINILRVSPLYSLRPRNHSSEFSV